MASSTHKLYLNGSYVGKMASATPVGLPAQTATTQVVTVQFENPALVQQLVKGADQKTASYRIESDLLVMNGEDRIDIKTSNQGALDLRALAETK